jgi:hypothetical protein
MDVQVDYFNVTRGQLDALLGRDRAREFLRRKAIFSVTVGSNDFLNNYLMPVLSTGTRIRESPDAFVDDLIFHLRDQLTVRTYMHACMAIACGRVLMHIY